MNKEAIRILMWNAWKAAANAYRIYPENKHTFIEYYHTIGEKELDEAIEFFENEKTFKELQETVKDLERNGEMHPNRYEPPKESKANPCICGSTEYYLSPIVGARCSSCNKPLSLKK